MVSTVKLFMLLQVVCSMSFSQRILPLLSFLGSNNGNTPASTSTESNSFYITPNCSSDPGQKCTGQPGCRDVTVIPALLSVAVLISPFYEQVTSNISYIQNVDNICYTFFPISASVFLLFRSVVYSDGSNVVEVHIESDVPGCPGVLRAQGLINSDCGSATCLYNDYVIGSGLLACPDVFILYRCYFLGICKDREYEADYRSGLSATQTVSYLCRQTIRRTANSQQFKGSTFYDLPNRLNNMCVTEFNGAHCINAFRVAAKDSICFPFTI